MKTLLVFLGAAVALAAGASADVLHVPGDYSTIQAAIDAAAEGDLVLVAAGNYPEEIQLKRGVIVQGAGAGASVIDGGGDAGDAVQAAGNDIGTSTRLEGFTITGVHSGGSLPGGAGIFLNSGASPEIRGNRIEGCDFGIATWNGAAPLIRNNVLVNNVYDGLAVSSMPVIVNNTIDGNGDGISDGGGYSPVVMNNIVTSNDGDGIYALGASPVLSYNCVHGNGLDYHNCSAGPGDISLPPAFTGGGDYHLAAGSPCIDAGNPAPEYEDPDGSRSDMGAYGGPGAESDEPRVTAVEPAQDATGVEPAATVAAVFDRDMEAASFDQASFQVHGLLSGRRTGTIAYAAGERRAAFAPAAPFLPGEPVLALLSTDVASAGGAGLDGFAWHFSAAAGGSGSLAAPEAIAVGSTPIAAVLADLDADGVLDLIVAQWKFETITVRLGTGDGSFGDPLVILVGGHPSRIAAADFDADGNLDLATANTYARDVELHFGQGDGTFTSATIASLATSPSDLAAGDFDHDGRFDLAIAMPAEGQAVLLRGAGGGAFEDAGTAGLGTAPERLVLADFDGDGWLDLAAADRGGDRLAVAYGAGGTFAAAQFLSADPEPCSLPAGDLTGDGRPDLAAGSCATGLVSVFAYRGGRTFAPAMNYSAVDAAMDLALGDVDGDADLDVLVADSTVNDLALLENLDRVEVTETVPAAGAASVPGAAPLEAGFNQALHEGSITGTSFLAYGETSGPHPGTVYYVAPVPRAFFTPETPFWPGERVWGLLTSAIANPIGVHLEGYAWEFHAAVPAASAGAFDHGPSVPLGGGLRGLWAADLDGDGDADLASTTSEWPNPGALVVLVNQGGGSFAAGASCAVAPDPIDLFGGDLDGDGDFDFAVAHNEPGLSHLSISLGDGAGAFSTVATYAPARLGQAVTGADFDGDGDLDLAMTDGWGNADNVHVMLNQGGGVFSGPTTFTAGTWARGVVAADLTGDGRPDLAVANSGSSSVSVLKSVGHGLFAGPFNAAAGGDPDGLVAGDFDGDGALDLAVSLPAAGSLAVLLGNGDGSFAAPVLVASAGEPQSIAAADLDGDGVLDLALAGSSELAVHLGAGDGSFADATIYALAAVPRGLARADLNGDAALDLACTITSEGAVQLFFNKEPQPTATPTPAPTPTPVLGVRIEMPLMARPGEPFSVTGYLDNPGPALVDVPVFFILEVFGEYWFWDDWAYYAPPESEEIDWVLMDVPIGSTEVPVVPEFIWPATGDEVGGLRFWGAMLNAEMDDFLGEYAMLEWGYSQLTLAGSRSNPRAKR